MNTTAIKVTLGIALLLGLTACSKEQAKSTATEHVSKAITDSPEAASKTVETLKSSMISSCSQTILNAKPDANADKTHDYCACTYDKSLGQMSEKEQVNISVKAAMDKQVPPELQPKLNAAMQQCAALFAGKK